MSTIDERQSGSSPGQESFVRKALADVDRAYRFQRVRQIVISVLALGAAFWLVAFRGPGPELRIVCTVIIILGLAMGVCTAKIMSLINKNTKVILRAVADLHDKAF